VESEYHNIFDLTFLSVGNNKRDEYLLKYSEKDTW